MADILCPMCSKTNSPEAEFCQFCQARLKPLVVQPPASQPEEDREADWLRGLRDDDGLGKEPQPPAAPLASAPTETPALPEGEMPDWLTRIRQRTQDETDSVSQIGPAPKIEETTDQSAEELPEWLRDLSLTDSDASGMQIPPTAPPKGSAQPVHEEQVQALPSDTPSDLDNDAWLRSLGDWVKHSPEESLPPTEETPAPVSQAPTPAEPLPESQIPDGLHAPEAVEPENQDWQPLETPPPGIAPASEPTEGRTSFGITDWLRALDGQAQPTAAPEETPQSTPDSEWLRNFDATASEPTPASTPQENAQPFMEQTPDWLSDFGAETQTSPAAPQEETTQETPDWLSRFGKEAAAEEVPPSPAFDDAPGALPAEALPEWLRAIDTQQPAAGTPAFAGAEDLEPISPFTGQGESTWVSSSELPLSEQEAYELPAFTAETEATPAVTESGGLAEWAAEKTPLPTEITNQAGEGIEPAQLPAWLQAMRPLDASIQRSTASLDQDMIEKSGPLAGICGVLPGEEVVSQYRKPPIYSTRLRVSEKQQVLATLLETVVAEEPLAQPFKGETAKAPHLVVRLIVGLLLVVVIVFALLVKPFLGIPAGQLAPGTAANQINRFVSELAESAPVLVVIDYEAGLSGELKAAAVPIIQHLMSRKTRIALVSTQAVGPVLGETLLKEATNPTRGGVAGYSITQSSANLGYLVGGAMALRELSVPMDAKAPRPLQQALPNPFRAENGWNGLVLKSLSQITDFKRVFLITDSIESSRAWIEQVQPALKNKTPLVVISSAQAAPLLQPYQTSGQIDALLSGLVGGRAYEEIQRRPAVAGAYWNAYQAALGMTILLIIFGGIVMGINSLITRSKKKNQARG